MILILCMGFPSMLALAFFIFQEKRQINTRTLVFFYFAFTLAVNLILFFVLALFFEYSEVILDVNPFNVQFTIRYLLSSSFISVILGKIISNFYLNSFKMKIIKNEATEKPGKAARVVVAVVTFLSIFLYYSTEWLISNFGLLTPDELIFHLKVPMKGANSDFVSSYLVTTLPKSLILTILVCIVVYYLIRRRELKIRLKDKLKQWSGKKIYRLFTAVVMPMILLASVANTYLTLNIVDIISYIGSDSAYVEEHYVSPNDVRIQFPEQKRNLIYIYMESMETTYVSEDMGGHSKENLVPELTALASENIYFSSSDVFNGAYQMPGTGWTIGGMVAQSSGLPLKLPIQGNSYNEYDSFLPGTISLGDILKEEGYNQTLLVGSDAAFGGRQMYYEQHGDHKILDYYTAPEDGIIEEGYKVWWGFEDVKLYDYAKMELANLVQQDEPFNLTMLTVDTHHIAGYVCQLCDTEHAEQYSNVISCASRQVTDFVHWIQEQDFYENTTIVISGDHLSMDADYFDDLTEEDRNIFNTFINAPVEVDDSLTKNRLFTPFDMFPSTLASMGVTIEGERLGLGTNLFSGTPTIVEENDKETVIAELNKKSEFYNNTFLYSEPIKYTPKE